MTQLVVTGFASLDYPVSLAGMALGDRTTLIRHRDPQAWPRFGGCSAYVAAAAARRGIAAAPVSWVGSDEAAEFYCSALRAEGCETAGVARRDAARSPVALLAYQQDGSCICLYDPAFGGTEVLTPAQSELISTARHLAITVGPPQLTAQILALRHPQATLYWVLKNDPACFPPDICVELSAVAAVIFCNGSERKMISATRADTVIVETGGTGGVTVIAGGRTSTCPVNPLSVSDTTGAGDTLAGGFIAAMMDGETDPVEAARQGITAVRDLLEQRLQQQRTTA